MSLRTIAANYRKPEESGHAVQALSHQFENLEQQNDSYVVGMWSFLLTEVMFFGALFCTYGIYRMLYPATYLDAHRFLDIKWGGLNTLVLLSSSWLMAMSVWAAQQGKQALMRWLLVGVIVCSFGFLGIKSIEYGNKFREGLFPGPQFDYSRALRMHAEEERESGGGGHAEFLFNPKEMKNPEHYIQLAPDEVRSNRAQLFFSIYFTMTGLHGIHVIVGIIAMALLWFFSKLKNRNVQDYMPTEMVGLYWHFVDIVWIFLFPLMYLIS